jgi:hypothetical protein
MSAALMVTALAAGCLNPQGSGSPSASSGQPVTSGPLPSAALGLAWQELDPAPVALIEAAAAGHAGEIWLAGGLEADGSATAGTWRFDPASGSWTPGPSLPEAVHHAALVSTGEELLLIGGYRGSSFSDPRATVLRLLPGGAGWVEDAPLPEERAAGAAAWDGARIIYAGGVRGGGAVSDGVLAWDGERWFALGEMSQPREHLSAASDGAGRVWLLGGRTLTLDTNLGSVEYVEGNLVARVAELPTPRGGAAAFYLPGVGACLAGGEQVSGAYDLVECIGDDLAVVRLPDMPGARHGHAAVIADGAVYVLLGGPEPLLTVSDTVQRLSADDG